jgi:antitoxin HicB
MLSYPARLTPTATGSVRACFPDVPEAITEGANEEDALNRAKFVLEQALAGYLMHGRAIPHPSDICGAPSVQTAKFGPGAPDAVAERNDEVEQCLGQAKEDVTAATAFSAEGHPPQS